MGEDAACQPFQTMDGPPELANRNPEIDDEEDECQNSYKWVGETIKIELRRKR